MRLGFLVDAKGRVPVKVITRTFASGKTEKLVYQGLSELGLPSGKNESMDREEFTFDKFYSLYHKICPRNDIEELFRSMYVCIFFFNWFLFRQTNNLLCVFRSTQGKAEKINIAQFINFLNEKQRDPRLNEILYPLYDEKRAIEIIETYEQSDEAKTASRFRYIYQ